MYLVNKEKDVVEVICDECGRIVDEIPELVEDVGCGYVRCETCSAKIGDVPMDEKEFQEVMDADTSTKDGALSLLKALSNNDRMTDKQFDAVIEKLMRS